MQEIEKVRRLRSRIVKSLNVPQRVRLGSRQGRLTNWPASTNVALIIHRALDLAAALLDDLFEPPAGAPFRCENLESMAVLAFHQTSAAKCGNR